ncbi:MAG: tRNA (adenosine(37)-N6)-threonylcarbamoyltransferase complex ATPase subunit type 1 TsaE [Candidatus Buchananbacteria bacterium RIFCSPHIGHO2_01_FULL_39_14]|uniref:tRNA threonylcarbamoyladenosine biosynthesis protein TsaE n=2 Tax=Candidatus Buchananiibacteriota TaxID=1817903 RepID=A0A1G1YTM3_9BACT|nr:MAG: tRNA (adenosine(37)-N6)-threonylcarbamoyltransferase complex ATPase subunit type 1 TsaE [Candidatus Buchananbacteria bacterium RIFCSPHIGHO2_01_FULL_39_14]OGY49407.1 MAG: tRNA (adenosine(37)-N6)-threonylcarbamoyltransferase complex ATPase subunit type 1 TsaE [Candidatus Buchananbacteria bacterium RIFCSPHIGHO2_02_FULL_39_17]OGY55705.1 MAG: tRNA (adenosine(37)-N6)-threonylcarbamoyltransferase complex ATPase subunit type 1 TsaE [Candidatus Buchananbacteria bacterium RIFCSPLOWO2_01_FULL_40_23b
MQKILTHSEKQTFDLGKKLAKALRGGEILALTGPLGAGKTVLAKGLAAGLGIKKTINSPTFILMKIYQLKAKNLKLKANKLIHLDCYRLKNPQEIINIGAKEYFGQPNTITVIEWAEKIKSILPSGQTKNIRIRLKGANHRQIIIDK